MHKKERSDPFTKGFLQRLLQRHGIRKAFIQGVALSAYYTNIEKFLRNINSIIEMNNILRNSFLTVMRKTY